MDDHEIRKHLEIFISQINTDRNPYTAPVNHREIPKRIIRRWKLWGQNAELHDLTHYNNKGINLWIPPRDLEKPCILLLAHHDTVPNCPGVDDNGSGMALLDFLVFYFAFNEARLNIAFAMVDWEESDPRLWKIFEKWSNGLEWSDMTEIDRDTHYNFRNYLHKHLEDIGTFLGTRKLYDFIKNKEIKIEAVLNFETVGYTGDMQRMPKGVPIQPDKGDFIALIGNMTSQYLIENIMRTSSEGYYLPFVVPMNGRSIPDTRRSDHSVFWDDNIAAIMITDTANYRNPHYHMETDTELDYDFMVELCRSMIKLMS